MEKVNIIQFKPQVYFSKNLVIVHPNPDVLNQLVLKFQDMGYSVFAFKRVKDANARIHKMYQQKAHIHKIIVPKNLWVSYNFSYKDFLNHMFPGYTVVTVDEKEYRDTINLRQFKREYKYV